MFKLTGAIRLAGFEPLGVTVQMDVRCRRASLQVYSEAMNGHGFAPSSLRWSVNTDGLRGSGQLRERSYDRDLSCHTGRMPPRKRPHSAPSDASADGKDTYDEEAAERADVGCLLLSSAVVLTGLYHAWIVRRN